VRTARAGAPALAVVRDPVEALDAARSATVAAGEALAKAQEVETQAVDDFDREGTDDAGAAAGRASAERGRCERVLTRCQEQERAADAAVCDAERAKLGAELDAGLKFLAGQDFSSEIAQLLALDEKLRAIVDGLADRHVELLEVHERCVSLGTRLSRTIEVSRARRPTLQWVSLMARIAISRARAEAKNDPGNHWICSEPAPDWKSPSRPDWDRACRELDATTRKGK